MNRNSLGMFPRFAIPTVILFVAVAFGPVVHAQNPNFSIDATPSYLCVNPGIDARSTISLQSVDGFAGRLNLGDNVDPAINGGPTLSAIPSSVTLTSGQTTSFDLTISTTASTPLRIYYVTVSGLSGTTFHQASIQLTVNSGCSVGGSVLSLDPLSLFSPYLAIAVLVGSIAILITGLVTYRSWKTKTPL